MRRIDLYALVYDWPCTLIWQELYLLLSHALGNQFCKHISQVIEICPLRGAQPAFRTTVDCNIIDSLLVPAFQYQFKIILRHAHPTVTSFSTVIDSVVFLGHIV